MNRKAIALVAIVIGIGLLFWGYQESQVIGNRFARALTNEWNTKTMVLCIAGAASLVFGLFTFFRK